MPEAWRHCVLVGLMGVGKTTVGSAVASQLYVAYHDSDSDIEAATGLTVRALGDRDGVDAMHALEARVLMDALDEPGPSIIAAAASIIDDVRCRAALAAPGIVVVWLRARAEVLAGRFESPDEHRPGFGESPEALLARQLLERGAALQAISTLAIDVDGMTPDDVAARVVEALR
jgi:shikimate kinase